MATRKFNKQDLIDSVLDGYSSEDGKLIFVEQSEWTQDHKYQHQTIIFQFEDKFYSITNGRCGSPFSDWHYDSENWGDEVECCEVIKKEITTYKWVNVE